MTDFSFAERLPETIATRRLLLRHPDNRDVETLARLANNEKIHAMVSRIPFPYRRSDAEEFIAANRNNPDDSHFAITTRDSDLIGIAGLHRSDGADAEIGYWLGEPYWGEGYASETTMAIVDAARSAGCCSLMARVRDGNTASMRVLEKTGFYRVDARIDDCGPHKGIKVVIFSRELEL